MDEAKLKKILSESEAPAVDENARKRALNLAVAEFKAFENERKNTPQGISFLSRLIRKTTQTRRDPMQIKSKQRLVYGGMATAMAVVLIAGVTFTELQVQMSARSGGGDASAVSSTGNNFSQISSNVTTSTGWFGGKKDEKKEITAPPGTEQASPAYVGAIEEQTRQAADSSLPTPIEPPVGRLTVTNERDDLAVAQSNAGAAYAPMKSKGMVARSAEMAKSIAPYAPPPGVILPEPMPPQYYQDEGRDKFENFKVSPVKMVSQEPVSTFSIDVDTASYSVVRRQLNSGALPNPDAVRVEEMINYFDYNYPLPESREQPFKPTVTVLNSPWNKDKKLVHIGIKGFDVQSDHKPHSNLVFLVDVSGSMESPDKLPLVKSSLKMLLDTLQPDDTVALTVYAGSAGTVLEPTKVSDKQTIINAIDNLSAGGSTAGAAGIEEAYRLAQQHFDKEGVNRVIIATDGDFNVGYTGNEDLKTIIEKKRESGIFLSVLGFGMGNLNDSLMQTLAQNGNGTAAYIDNINEARKVLVDEASSTLFPIAKDVKIQVEFNPALVQEYRLVGYETRALNREDFNNDKIDAGDIGAGHAVTAIYEITPVGATPSVDPSRYAAAETAAKPAEQPKSEFANELGFLKMRYKLPNSDTSKLITTPILNADSTANSDANFAIAVAGFAQLLKGDQHVTITYDDVLNAAQANKGSDEFGYRAEFINMVRTAKAMAH